MSRYSSDIFVLLTRIPSVRVFIINNEVVIEFNMDNVRNVRELYILLQSLHQGRITFADINLADLNFTFSIMNNNYFQGNELNLAELIRVLELFLYDPTRSKEDIETFKRMVNDFFNLMDDAVEGSGSLERLNKVLNSFYNKKDDNSNTTATIRVKSSRPRSSEWKRITGNRNSLFGIPNYFDDYHYADSKLFKSFLRGGNDHVIEELLRNVQSQISPRNAKILTTYGTPLINKASSSKRQLNNLVSRNVTLKRMFKPIKARQENSIKRKIRNKNIDKSLLIQKDKISSILNQAL